MASQAGRLSFQVLGMVVLARILDPDDFGKMAIALTVANFASMFRDLGVASTLIQKMDVNGDDVWTAFWVYIALGLLLSTCLVACSNPMARWLGSPESSGLIRGLAIALPVSSVGGVQQARLERASRFKELAIVELASAFVGLGTALTMAIAGFGAWSLVGQTLAASMVGSVLLWWIGDALDHGRFRLESFSQMLDFGGNLTAFNVVNYFARNADNMLIGRWLGAEALGVYSQAYRLMMLPVQNLTFVAGRALLPVMSRIRTEQTRVWGLYLDSVGVVSALAAPLLVGMIVLRKEFVFSVLGEKWGGVVALLPWLCLAGAIQSVVSLTGTVLISLGRVRLHLLLGVIGAILQVTSFIIGIQGGLAGLVHAYAVANIANAILVLGVLIPICGGNITVFAGRVGVPYLIAIGSFLGARWSLSLLSPQADISVLFSTSVAGTGTYLLIMNQISPWHVERLMKFLPVVKKRC